LNRTKRFICILTFLFIHFLNAQVEKKSQPLHVLLKQIELQFDCYFSYADKTIEGVVIHDLAEFNSIKDAIRFIKKQSKLKFVILQNNYISISPPHNQKIICGYLIDLETQEPIEDVVISIKSKTVSSNENGFFEFQELPLEGLIKFNHMSFKNIQLDLTKFEIGDCEAIYLIPRIEQMNEVIVRNVLTKGIQKGTDGSYIIDYRKFNILPGLIEPDVLQSIQALPGVQSVDESVSNLNIHGGAHHENLMLWDGIKMYQSGHFFGLISAFNPYLTEQATLIRNGTDANLSEGVSGTILMNTDQKVSHEFEAEFGLNLINIDALLNVPIAHNSSLKLASRKSINNLIKTPTYQQYFDKAFQNSEVVNGTENVIHADDDFSFYDLNVQWLYDVTIYDKISANFILFNNNLVFSENALIDGVEESKESSAIQDNMAGGLSYERAWSDYFKTNLQFYITAYGLKSTNHDLLNDQRIIQENEVLEGSVKLDTEFEYSDRFTFYNGYHYQETGVTNIQDVDNPLFVSKVKQVLRSHGLSSQIGYKSNDGKTSSRIGLRFNYIEQFGKFLLEPRLSFSQKLTPNFKVQVLGEMKHQTAAQIVDFQDDFLGIENRRWILSNSNLQEEDAISIPIIESLQGSLGIFYVKKGWLVSAEGYYKNVDGISARSQGFQNQYQYSNETGSYNVYGVDFLIRKRFENFNSWLSYSYVDNTYAFDSFTEQVFPNNFDIRHSVSFATTYGINKFDISAGVNWHTGKPTTNLVKGNEVVDSNMNYEPANSGRLDDYMRVDISGQYKFKFSKKVNASFGVSVWNLLNTKTISNTYYNLVENQTVKQFDQISLGFTPNVSFRIYF
jgi:hypothetical protein